MSFVGSLPTAGDRQSLSHSTVPSKSMAVVTLTAYDLTDPANGLTPCATEFYCTTAGNLIAQLAGDTAVRTYTVVAKDIVRGLFVKVDATSTAVGLMRQ